MAAAPRSRRLRRTGPEGAATASRRAARARRGREGRGQGERRRRAMATRGSRRIMPPGRPSRARGSAPAVVRRHRRSLRARAGSGRDACFGWAAPRPESGRARDADGSAAFASPRVRGSSVLRLLDREPLPELGDLLPHAARPRPCRGRRGRGTGARSCGTSSRPVLREVVEEVLAGARSQVQDVRPDRGRAGVAGGAHDVGHELRLVRQAGQDRRHADARLDAGVAQPAAARASRWRGGGVFGSVSRQILSSSVGTENVTETFAHRAASTRTSMSRTIIGAAGDDRERVARLREDARGSRASAGSDPRRAGTGPSPRRSRRARPSSAAVPARAGAPRRRWS